MSTYKFKIEKSRYHAYQRAALVNRNPKPWTKASAYDVSTYTFVTTPARESYDYRTSFTSPWRHVDSEVDYEGIHESRMDVDNFTHHYAPIGVEFGSELDQLALSKLHAFVRESQDHGFNAAVFGAEFGKTVEMFANSAIRLNRSIRALKRGRIREAWEALGLSYAPRSKNDPRNRFLPSNVRVDDRTASGRMSNALLEVQYGWRPLVNDLDSAAKKFASNTALKPPTFRITAGAARTVATKGGVPGNARQGGYAWTHTVELQLRHMVKFRVSDELIAHAASYGFTNPMLVIHEVIPLSFVLDWFINVGGWLQNFSTFHGLQFLDGCTSSKGFTTISRVYPGWSDSGTVSYESSPGVYENHPGFTRSVSDGSIFVKSSGFRRTTWSSFPAVPKLKFNDKVKKPLLKLAVSLALLRQRRGTQTPGRLFA